MNGFKNIYSENDIKKAQLNLRKGLIVFCAVALLFAAFCTVFVVLYVKTSLSVYICFSLNFVATVAFVWYAVVYFVCGFAKAKNLINFYGIFENADLKPDRGEFAGASGTVTEKTVVYERLVFRTYVGETEFLIESGIKPPFAKGQTYDLLSAGNKIFAYKGAEND